MVTKAPLRFSSALAKPPDDDSSAELSVAAVADAPAEATPAETPVVTGIPIEIPPTSMLSAPITCCAAMSTSPCDPIPASPASTLPMGAKRYTAPGFRFGVKRELRMPLPATAAWKLTEPSSLMMGGGTESAVLAPRPASILPPDDQSRISPPSRANTR